jgi:hypothetical protein
MPFGFKNVPPAYQRAMSTSFRDYLGVFTKLFLDDFNNLYTHLTKLQLCFHKCTKFNISLNPTKCMFLVHLGIILGYVVSNKVSESMHEWMDQFATQPKSLFTQNLVKLWKLQLFILVYIDFLYILPCH